jgi:hypothetical protein
VTASTDIVQDLAFTKNNDLSFGQISNSQTANAILDPQNTNTANVGNTTTFGEIEVIGAPSSSIVISFTNPANLSDGNGNTIGFTPDYSGKNGANNIGGSSDLNTGSNNTVTTGGASGKYYIYYGGTLDGGDIDNAATGNYTGTIKTTIDYQ